MYQTCHTRTGILSIKEAKQWLMRPLPLPNCGSPLSVDEYERAFREVAQEHMLLGLWRAKFFERAAFYGGTALRLLHGMLWTRIESLEVAMAKADVRTFIKDQASLDLWSKDFFLEIARRIRYQET